MKMKKPALIEEYFLKKKALSKGLLPLASPFPSSWMLCKRDFFCEKVESVGEFSWWVWKMVEGFLLDRSGKGDLELPLSGLFFISPTLQCWWINIWNKVVCEVMRHLQPNYGKPGTSLIALYLFSYGMAGIKPQTKGITSIFKNTSQFIKDYNPHISLVIQKNPRNCFQMGNSNPQIW